MRGVKIGGQVIKRPSIRILFVEDLPTDVILAERELRKNEMVFTSRRVDTGEGLKIALQGFNPDIVVSDYSMPAFDGMSALRIVKEFDPDIPFLVLTGSMNEEVAVECMKAGACDYVIKEHLSRLAYAIQVAIERKQLEASKKAQEKTVAPERGTVSLDLRG